MSGALVLLGLLALVQIGRGAANLSIDFTGGTSVQVRFDQPIQIDRARHALVQAGLQKAELQDFAGGDRLLVRVKSSESVEEKVTDRIISALRDAFPGHQVTVETTLEIGPTIGDKLRQDALIAIAISPIGIVLFYLLNKEITLLVVTALLTLAGYSLTDKVVVFDRIRGNVRVRRRETIEATINNGINQVLSRTIVTRG